MRFPNATLRTITITLGCLMACLFLLFGVANLINPDVSDSYLVQNTRICVILILTGLVSLYALFRPNSGGIFLCICAVALSFVSGGFLGNPLTSAALLLGVLSIIRGHLSPKAVSKEPDQPS